MDHLLIAGAALAGSALTLISGFGLGTLLTPVFALVLPVEAAIAATAIVHLANNAFKLGLVGRLADWRVAARFGIPATAAALAGAGSLAFIAGLPPVGRYDLLGRAHTITPVNLMIGLLILAFACLEFSTRFKMLAIPARFLLWGGLLSGFFGGLSGNQGALRSAFLIKAGLGKEAFVATGVVCAIAVDVARIAVYGGVALGDAESPLGGAPPTLLLLACLSASIGAVLGARLMRSMTMRTVRYAVAVGMMGVGAGLALGLI